MPSILVVEDNPTIRVTVARLLSSHGYSVRAARDGLVALSALRVFEPDLALLGMRLPYVDGIQLCLGIRRFKKYADLPIVMLLGLAHEVDIQRALDAGANDYLVRPVDNATLLATIADHVGRRARSRIDQWQEIQAKYDYPVDDRGRPINPRNQYILRMWRNEGISRFVNK